MIAALLFAAAGATPTWCDSIHTVAQATAEAQARGTPRAAVDQADLQLPTSEARHAAAAIAELAYGRNSDRGLSPIQFARLVRQACMHPELP